MGIHDVHQPKGELMVSKQDLGGVVPAVATPLKDGELHLANLKLHLRQLAEDGSCGVLLMGTTGEGPSLSLAEREAIVEAGREYAGDMMLMAGTGCASLAETITLTRRAFESGAEAVVVVPPFYFKSVSEEGLLTYYRALLDEAIPGGGLLVLYHIPQVSGVPISFDLLEKLLAVDSERVAGIKDSSGDIEHSRALCRKFPDLRVFVGDDKLLHEGLKAGAVGSITAGGNVLAALAAAVYKVYQDGQDATPYQDQLTAARSVLDGFTPFPASVKSLLAARYGSDGWDVRPPLTPLPEAERAALLSSLAELGLPQEHFAWLYKTIPSTQTTLAP